MSDTTCREEEFHKHRPLLVFEGGKFKKFALSLPKCEALVAHIEALHSFVAKHSRTSKELLNNS